MASKVGKERRKAAKESAAQYMTKTVDPVLGDLIKHLLLAHPDSVCEGALAYFRAKLRGVEQGGDGKVDLVSTSRRVSKVDRIYMARDVSPIVSQLIAHAVRGRPVDVVPFFVKALEEMARDGPNGLDSLGQPHLGDGPCEPVGDQQEVPSSRAVSKLEQARQLDASLEATPPAAAAAAPVVVATPPAAAAAAPVVVVAPPAVPRELRIILLGMDLAGKTTLVRTLQGDLDPATRPSTGFRATKMQFDDSLRVCLHDVGGGKRVRSLWKNYVHDCHAVIYVVDGSEAGAERRAEARELFDSALGAAEGEMAQYLQGKPLLVLANKQDEPAAAAATEIAGLLGLPSSAAVSPPQPPDAADGAPPVAVMACTAHAARAGGAADPRLEAAVEWLVAASMARYDSLEARVASDIELMAQRAAEAKAEKERNVFRTVLRKAFPEEGGSPIECMPPQEGREFLAAELGIEGDAAAAAAARDAVAASAAAAMAKANAEAEGTERPEDPELVANADRLNAVAAESAAAALPEEASEIAVMVNYQKLALQMIANMKVPISKKNVPKTWPEIKEYVLARKAECSL